MHLHLRLGLALGVGAGVATACGHHHDNAPPPPSSLTGSGGTRSSGGSSGRGGTGGTKHGAAGQSGEAGEGGANGGSSAGTHGGRGGTGGTHGEAGGPEGGFGGVPYSGDMGSGGTAGGAGAPGPGDGNGHLFVGPGGDDGGPGTREQPFLTLAGAVSVAERGDTIVFLDGNYAIAKGADAVTIPDGVSLAADNPRFAGFVGDGGTLLEFAGNSELDGLRFDGFETVVAAAANDASVTITRASFTNCPSDSGKSALEIGGDTLVTVTDDSKHDLGDCPALAHVYGQGKLSIDGELLHFNGSNEAAAFVAEDSARLDLSNLDAEDGNLPLLVLRDDSTTTLGTSTVVTKATHLVELWSSPSLDVTSTQLSLDAAVTSPDACIATTNGIGSTLALKGAVLHGCKGALVGPAPKTFTLDSVEIFGMSDSGLALTAGASSNVSITASLFHHLAHAVQLGGGTPSTFTLKVRGTTLGEAVDSGFELAGDGTSTWDFGTLADPGNNLLTATTTALDVQNSAITAVSAVGNTWTPGVQSADGAGRYSAPSSPGVLEVTSGSGQNYTDSAGATLRLAESN